MQVDTLDRALVVLKRGQTFMQSKSMNADLQKIATGLKAIVQGTWVNSKQKAMVQSLLQSEDEDLSLQPQATTAACAAAVPNAAAESKAALVVSGSAARECDGQLEPQFEDSNGMFEPEGQQSLLSLSEHCNKKHRSGITTLHEAELCDTVLQRAAV